MGLGMERLFSYQSAVEQSNNRSFLLVWFYPKFVRLVDSYYQKSIFVITQSEEIVYIQSQHSRGAFKEGLLRPFKGPIPSLKAYPLVTSFLTFQTFVAHGFQDSVNNL